MRFRHQLLLNETLHLHAILVLVALLPALMVMVPTAIVVPLEAHLLTVVALLHPGVPLRPQLFVLLIHLFIKKKVFYADYFKKAPNPSNVLGVFGLSIRTQERDLDEEFSRFGRVEKVTIVYDQRVCLAPTFCAMPV